jgi:hypothetical protein
LEVESDQKVAFSQDRGNRRQKFEAAIAEILRVGVGEMGIAQKKTPENEPLKFFSGS